VVQLLRLDLYTLVSNVHGLFTQLYYMTIHTKTKCWNPCTVQPTVSFQCYSLYTGHVPKFFVLICMFIGLWELFQLFNGLILGFWWGVKWSAID